MDPKTQYNFIKDLCASFSNISAQSKNEAKKSFSKISQSYNDKNPQDPMSSEMIDIEKLPNIIKNMQDTYGPNFNFLNCFEGVLSDLNSQSDPSTQDQLDLIKIKYEEIKMKYQYWKSEQDINNF
jgi:hypothetical protein